MEPDVVNAPELRDRSAGPDETQQRILAAAEEAFGRIGYTRATTRLIATAAGVNEVTIFRHFGSKANLLRAVIKHSLPLDMLTGMVEQGLSGDYVQDVRWVAQFLFRQLVERHGAMIMLLGEADHVPELREILVQIPRQLRSTLAGYLRRYMETGEVRELDPDVTAQAFMGMFVSYSLFKRQFAEPIRPDLTDEGVVDRLVDLFVQGTLKHRDG